MPRTPKVRHAGRQTDLTPEMQAKIIGLITRGEFIEVVCGIVGIAKQTFYNWRNRGEAALQIAEEGGEIEEREAPYMDFALEVDRALGIAEAWDNNNIRGAAEGGKPTKTVTRRRFPVLDRGTPVLDESGQPVYAEEETVTEGSTSSQWQASAWRLERKFPNRYGRRVQAELTGKDGKPIEVANKQTIVFGGVEIAF